MNQPAFPHAAQYRDLNHWARAVSMYFQDQVQYNKQPANPTALMTAHRTDRSLERAVTDGLILYDPRTRSLIVSQSGVFVPLDNKIWFDTSYNLAAGVDGAALSAGANVVPFNSMETDDTPLIDDETTAGYFTFQKGVYELNGQVALAKSASVAEAITFTGYIAKTTDLTTAISDAMLGSLYIASNVAKNATHTMPLSGKIEVPSEGTYALVVRASTGNAKFGAAHGLTGYQNEYARLKVALQGLNE